MVTSPGFRWDRTKRILKAVAVPPQSVSAVFAVAESNNDITNQRLVFEM
jgi:hypothetical protein